jgi:hypothetical protein
LKERLKETRDNIRKKNEERKKEESRKKERTGKIERKIERNKR